MTSKEIRESEFFLTVKLIILELFFGLIFLFFTTILDFFELGSQETITSIISWEGLLMIIIICLQIVLTITLVLKWVYSYYDISGDKITYHQGIILLSEKSLYLRDVQEIKAKKGLIGRIFNYGNIALVGSNRDTLHSLNRISNPDKYIRFLEDLVLEAKESKKGK